MIEKHFTLDRGLPGPDHRFSSDPRELAKLVEGVRRVEQMIGSARVGYTQAESSARSQYRVSCVARHDLPAGHVLGRDDVVFARPATGIPPMALRWIAGRRVSVPIQAGEAISLDHFR
jgi:N-acetylneuraminate synthase/N,N'-diacetyllegionaminate synthase